MSGAFVDIRGVAAATGFDGVDRMTNTIQTIEYEHHEVHAGSSFHCSDVVACNTTTVKWLVTTPNATKWPHVIFGLRATNEVTILVTEGADRDGATPLACVNHNRNSTATATTAIHRGIADGTTDGATTVLTARSGATGQAGKAVDAGEGRSVNEYVLKQNTKYVVSATTYGDAFVTLELDWYEHTNKN
jgi:hypothetical protein